jgi:hypothetical protein
MHLIHYILIFCIPVHLLNYENFTGTTTARLGHVHAGPTITARVKPEIVDLMEWGSSATYHAAPE